MSAMCRVFAADQDWVDRANGCWSVLLLSLSSIGAFLIRFIADPITCFPPSTFTHAHVFYTKGACFDKEEFHVSSNSSDMKAEMSEVGVSYHLWIPLVLFIQASCFKLPNIIWTNIKPYLSIDLDSMVLNLDYCKHSDIEYRQNVVQQATNVIAGVLQRGRSTVCILYLSIKSLYCINLFAQFVFLTVFFHQGLAMRAESAVGQDVNEYFRPFLYRDVMCDFTVHSRNKQYTFAVPCKLLINEIYEKMFVFLWYWVSFLALVTVLNLLVWIGFLFLPFLRNKRIVNYIQGSKSDHDSSSVTRFISGFLGRDGVLLLSMITQNSSEMMSAELSQQLYQVFLQQKRPAPVTSSPVTSSPAPQIGPTKEEVPDGKVIKLNDVVIQTPFQDADKTKINDVNMVNDINIKESHA